MEIGKEILVELKSEPMNEILSSPPRWIVRSGNGLFFGLLFAIGIISWIIKYPDEIVGEVLVTTTHPPIDLSNQFYAQLKSIKVLDKQFVRQGQMIAEFNDKANSKDIQLAQEELARLSLINLIPKVLLPSLTRNLRLGAIQNQWSELYLKIDEWNRMQKEDVLYLRIQSMEREIKFREKLEVISSQKIMLAGKDNELIQEELKSSDRLAKIDAISIQSLNQDRKSANQVLQSIYTQKEQYLQNVIQLNTLKKDISLLKHEQNIQQSKSISEIYLAVESIKTNLEDWEKDAFWLAPCNGKIFFNKQLQINRFYQAHQASIVIVPNGNGHTALAKIPTEGSGKIRKGQKANIELLDYPKLEFGTIQGVVENITLVDYEGKYEVQIKLPSILKSSFNRLIPLKAKLNGRVRIITKNKRLIERFFEKIIDTLK
jgi:multidrug resistance efflux pump